MIGSNLRTLKVVDLTYTMKNGLCANCGRGVECEVRDDSFQACDSYMPVIMFKDLRGTDTGFNTFRLGDSWFKRVKVGSIVALVNDQGECLSQAIVEAVRCDDRDYMIREHSFQNHLILARNSKTPVNDMRRILRNLYGPNFLARAEKITAIYLRRI